MESRSVECLECGGEGSYDSGGSTPWGEWINVPCGRCNGKGGVPVEELTGEELRFIATSPVCLAAPDLLAACEAIIEWGSKPWYPGKDDDLVKIFSSARAAVAKAKSERTVP